MVLRPARRVRKSAAAAALRFQPGRPRRPAELGRQRPGGLVVDAHAAAAGASGQEFALRTTDGGALVFYTDAAQVTVAAPPGSALHLSIPGFRSSSQGASPVQVSYLEQFAAYDPPAGGGAARVVADFSGITGITGTG